MSARSWTAGHPFDAGMTVPVFDRCLETVSQAHPQLGHPWLGLPVVEAIRVCSDPARGSEVAIASAWGQG